MFEEIKKYCKDNKTTLLFAADGTMQQVGGQKTFPDDKDELMQMSRNDLSYEILRLRQLINKNGK